MMLYKDIKVGMEVEFQIAAPSKKKKRARTDDDPFAPVSRTSGSGRVIFAGQHLVTIQMADGYKVTIEKVALTRMKTARIKQKKSSLAACGFPVDGMP